MGTINENMHRDFALRHCPSASESANSAGARKGRVRLTVPQATEWKRIGNQIDTALVAARTDFVNVS
jgi:hypothetical protein